MRTMCVYNILESMITMRKTKTFTVINFERSTCTQKRTYASLFVMVILNLRVPIINTWSIQFQTSFECHKYTKIQFGSDLFELMSRSRLTASHDIRISSRRARTQLLNLKQ